MTCGTCGGRHFGQCPGVRCTCGECGRSYVAGAGWHNHFLCSPGCCDVRWAKRHPPELENEEEMYW